MIGIFGVFSLSLAGGLFMLLFAPTALAVTLLLVLPFWYTNISEAASLTPGSAHSVLQRQSVAFDATLTLHLQSYSEACVRTTAAITTVVDAMTGTQLKMGECATAISVQHTLGSLRSGTLGEIGALCLHGLQL